VTLRARFLAGRAAVTGGHSPGVSADLASGKMPLLVIPAKA
jgi:hypothetical protein